MKTRLCSLLLILSMVAATFTLLVTPAMAEEGVVNTTPAVAPAVKTDFSDIPADAWWDGSVDTEFAGSGTEDDPYLISSAAELAGLAELTATAGSTYISAYYKLTADIYFNDPTPYMEHWNDAVSFNASKKTFSGDRQDFITHQDGINFSNPIAVSEPFVGHFDGGEHTIYGLAMSHTLNYNNLNYTGNVGLFANVGLGSVKNVNIAYGATVLYLATVTSTRLNGAGMICGAVHDNAIIDNCHVISSNLYTGSTGGGIVGASNKSKTLTITNSSFDGHIHLGEGTVNAAPVGVGGIFGRGIENDIKIIIENCSVSGLIKTEATARTTSHGLVQAAGIACSITARGSYLITNCVNYADVISTTDAGVGGIAGQMGYSGSGGPMGVIVVNTVNYGDVYSAGGDAGGIVARMVGNANYNKPDVAAHGVRVFNFINYGKITGVNAGQIIGIYGYGTPGVLNTTNEKKPERMDNLNQHFQVRNCLLAGQATLPTDAEGNTVTGNVGALIGQVQDGGYVSDTNYGAKTYQFILDHVYYQGNEDAFGLKSAELEAYLANEAYADYLKDYGPLATDMESAMHTLNEHASVCSKCPVPSKYDWTPNQWVMDASRIQGASLQLGSGIGINLYAKPENYLTFEGFNRIAVAKNGLYRAELKDMGKVTIDGIEYFHYQLPVNPAEIGDAFTFTLNNGYSIEYGVEAYAVRKHANGSAKLQGLLEALMAYGDAARVNKGGEAKSMAAIGKTYDASAIGTAYENLSMAPAEGGNVEGKFLAASLNLDGHINLLLKVAEDVANVKVSYTNQEGVVETTVPVVGGEAVYEGIVATALNLHYHLVALDEAGNAVGEMDWNVSRFIQNGLNSESFNDNQATLAKALALYMQSARIYTGLDVAAE